MGCAPSKGNVVHPGTPNLNSSKANGSIPKNSSTTVNGTSDAKLFTAECTKVLDELSSNQSNSNEPKNQSSKLKELEDTSATATTTTVTPYNDNHLLSCAVNDALQHHGNHEYHVLGDQPSLSAPKPPHAKITSLKASLRGPGTESQIEFFKMLDRKIEAGPDYEDK